MRYPGPHRHERLSRQVVLAAAILVFLLGILAVRHKEVTVSVAEMISPAPIVAISPTNPGQGTVILQLFNRETSAVLAGQSIVLIPQSVCTTGPCPKSSSVVLTADASGKVMARREIIQQKPKLYAVGYVLDTYFSFLDPQQPNLLTLYKPMPGTKVSYDISLDEVPIGLDPVK